MIRSREGIQSNQQHPGLKDSSAASAIPALDVGNSLLDIGDSSATKGDPNIQRPTRVTQS